MSSIRIISGTLRGQIIRLPQDTSEGMRPLTSRVREAMFSIIQSKLPGARVLDTCAGSGALAFEALSRNADAVTLIEKDSSTLKYLKENAKRLKLESRCTFIHADAFAFLTKHLEQYDLIFVDPPFANPISSEFWGNLKRVLSSEGWLVYRCSSKSNLNSSDFEIIKEKIYGTSKLVIAKAH